MTTIEMQPIPEKDTSGEAKGDEEPKVEGKDQPDGPVEVKEVVERFHSYQKIIKESLEWIRLIVVCGVAGCLILGVIYNLFASAEKDIPDEVFSKMYKFMQAEAGDSPNIPSIIDGKTKSSWPLPSRNWTNN